MNLINFTLTAKGSLSKKQIKNEKEILKLLEIIRMILQKHNFMGIIHIETDKKEYGITIGNLYGKRDEKEELIIKKVLNYFKGGSNG